MDVKRMVAYLEDVLGNMPSAWLNLTTHRLDIYDESRAKTQFIDQFQKLANEQNSDSAALGELPTAYDYIRLGHPLSSILEWALANINNLSPESVISFSSLTMPVFAVLRKNLLDNKSTRILYSGELPSFFDAEVIKDVYGYEFELKKVQSTEVISDFDGTTLFVSQGDGFNKIEFNPFIDFYINLHPGLGSVLLVNGESNEAYISEIQHVRRRETIAMTPINCLAALKSLVGQKSMDAKSNRTSNKAQVLKSIKEVTGTAAEPLVGSSGLSVQYAIMMGLVHDAQLNHPGKAIKFVVPPNCYGGTNDQARRVAACLENVDVVDLPVDREHDMVESVDKVLDQIAKEDAVPYIIAEIPTNPRVEVPDLIKLKEALSAQRKTASGDIAVDSVFILDQTFCPNIHFLGEGEILSTVRALSYASGSKFPSGGKCTAGYCVANNMAAAVMEKIGLHMELCDNEATDLQYEILAAQLPSMNERIHEAYKNTREFVTFINETLPTAKINFVSEDLAQHGFTPSVFSLDLPTKGNTDEERETYKRELNHKLIGMMISEIPSESKYCVSYGQLKGCYWTIPATSTQGTTKEGDKDYIARVALSPDMDLEKHKAVFANFVSIINH
ncbi:PLP-dependent transferase [Salibacteraceae bacterium]|nr:PLP-dependent transferase [Salibacteraceae bacterium]